MDTPLFSHDQRQGLLDECLHIERALRERIKELNCLYGITRLAQERDKPLPELLAHIADLICASWQYPEVACARIRLGSHDHATANYAPSPWRQVSPMRIRGELIGEVEVGYLEERPPCDEGPFLAEERSLINAVAELVARIIEQRWTDELMGALSRELIMAQENERQRIARELHDHLAQELSLAMSDLHLLARSLPNPEGVHRILGTLQAAIASIRDLAYGLLPPELSELGLVQALASLCANMSVRIGIPIHFSTDGINNITLPFDTQINLYRLVQEALANIRKHARATQASVRLIGAYPSLLLRIEDNGQGMNVERRAAQAAQERRIGLWSMRERARLLGGTISFRSKPGSGTRITLEIPLAKAQT